MMIIMMALTSILPSNSTSLSARIQDTTEQIAPVEPALHALPLSPADALSISARQFIYVPPVRVPSKKVVRHKVPSRAKERPLRVSRDRARVPTKIIRFSSRLDFSRCSDSSGIESGLHYNARMLYRAVCNACPKAGPFGGYRYDPGSLHYLGRAVDCMVPSRTVGDAVKDFVYANRKELHVMQIIWRQHIWTTDRPYWHLMEDRGSITANHYDHVHVSLY